MLIAIDSSPCSLSLRNRSTLCSTTKCHQNKSDLKNVFVQKSFFSISSILSIPIMLIGINGGYFPAICRVCLPLRFNGISEITLFASCPLKLRDYFWIYSVPPPPSLVGLYLLPPPLHSNVLYNNICNWGGVENTGGAKTEQIRLFL